MDLLKQCQAGNNVIPLFKWMHVYTVTHAVLYMVSPLQCRSSILVFILFIYVIYVTNHQNHCKCKMQMSVILCSHGLLD